MTKTLFIVLEGVYGEYWVPTKTRNTGEEVARGPEFEPSLH